MIFIEDRMDGGDGGGGGGGEGAMVVVGVKLEDSRSKELLTWALVKVARPGDRVLAFHVLDPNSEGGKCKTTLLSLLKTFDSVLSAYQGFCNLKQVDLKLKVFRGSPVRKILVEEVKSYGTASLVIGSSEAQQTIRSSVSVAKYCARKLSRNFSVFAVDNGKVVFSKEPTSSVLSLTQDNEHQCMQSLNKLSTRRRENVNLKTDRSVLTKDFNTKLSLLGSGNEKNPLALVPTKTRELPGSKHAGWSLLRRMLLHYRKPSQQNSEKKISALQRVLKLPKPQPWAVIYADEKSHNVHKEELPHSDLDLKCSTISLGTHFTYLNSFLKELKGLQEQYSSLCRFFSYQELSVATNNFMPENMIGKGGTSQVYNGSLPDGKQLAVKVLKPSENVLKQFRSEIEITTAVHHNHIVSLIGFCFEENNLLLVYEFLSRGSLKENLHGEMRSSIAFSWEDRYKVALGVAQALDYLHNGLAEPIIHRDVKSSNILLSDDFEPQLSDFGLAMWASSFSYNMECINVAGTFGYLAPEYFMHGKINEKIDVYAFGVVLLELLSGRKPVDIQYPKGQESLVMWAKQIIDGGKVSQLLDLSLGSSHHPDQIEKMILAATLCIRRAPRFRPQISFVLKLLQGDVEIMKMARQQVSAPEPTDALDVEQCPTDIQSFLNLALQNLEDDSS